MMRHRLLEPQFVQAVPSILEAGVLYVSMEYGTVIHSCCCGCGLEVVTPLTPTDWRLTYDGESVSLWPSVGNWNLPCQSHYVIDRNRVIESGRWSPERIEAERQRDEEAKTKFYASQIEPTASSSDELSKDRTIVEQAETRDGLWIRLLQFWR